MKRRWVQSRKTLSRSFYKDWNSVDDFFNYTRGRFVSDEEHQLAIRHVRFDMNELARLAAESAGAEECVHVEKLPDGMFNKSFLFTMGDGAQVVGKVPNPNAGQAHYTTASEVATMDFVSCIYPCARINHTYSFVTDAKYTWYPCSTCASLEFQSKTDLCRR